MLERYARSKGRLHLDGLPADVMTIIMDFLDGQDALSLVDALAGKAVDPFRISDLKYVPEEVQAHWFLAKFTLNIEHFLNHEVATVALFRARVIHGTVLAFVDWSPFPSISRPPWQSTNGSRDAATSQSQSFKGSSFLLISLKCQRPVARISLHVLELNGNVLH